MCHWVSDLLVNFFVILLQICNDFIQGQFYTAHSDLHDGKSVCAHVAQQDAQFEPMSTLHIVE